MYRKTNFRALNTFYGCKYSVYFLERNLLNFTVPDITYKTLLIEHERYLRITLMFCIIDRPNLNGPLLSYSKIITILMLLEYLYAFFYDHFSWLVK